jgi:hypothetical protein
MAKWTSDTVMDGALNIVKNGAIAMHVCTTIDASPTRAEVIAASLANVAMASTDYTLAAGATAISRKFTTAAKNGVAVTATGTAVNVCLIDATNVYDVTDCTSQALTLGNTVNIPAWAHELSAPT